MNQTTEPLRAERLLYASYALLALLAALGPHVPQAALYHEFADGRGWLGLPHAADVLSNLPFGVLGLMGLWQLARGAGGRARGFAGLLFGGLLLTCVGSSGYHLAPDDTGVFWDRFGMVPAFAGMLALAVQSRCGERPAWVTAALVLLAGPVSLALWRVSGQLLPWVLLQGGGMALLVVLACMRPAAGRTAWPLSAVVLWYALAKLLEWGDAAVWQWSGHWVSGHTLKHIAAALATWPMLQMLREES